MAKIENCLSAELSYTEECALNKKRIGILTFHRSINYGAFMQAYSLSHYLLKKYPDCTVEIIDYENKTMHEHYKPKFSLVTFRHPIISAKKSKQYKQFQKELNKIPLSKDYFQFDGKLDSFDKYIIDNYDIIIVGSDAVWNWVKRGFPNPYILDFDGPLKMSYAASAYGMDYLKQEETNLTHFADCINRIEYVGVRDHYTADFITNITSGMVKPEINCDPTFFLDMKEVADDAFPGSDNPSLDLKKKYHIPLDKKIIGVMEADTHAIIELRKQFKDYYFVSLFNHTRATDLFLGDLSPCEWALVFGMFELTLTNYYHGTLLSLVNDTPVISSDRTAFSKIHLGKIPDVMEKMGLSDCCFVGGASNATMINKIEEILNNRTKYVKKIQDGKKVLLAERASFDNAIEKIMVN